MNTMIPPEAVSCFLSRQVARFTAGNPRSIALGQDAAAHFLFGVPMHWMRDWPTPSPLFVEHARGGHLVTVDGHELVDFCLGDTGAMFGHSPPPIARVLAEHGANGLTTMLPGPDAAAVGEQLSQRFGLPCWQMAATASDANRFALRWARAVTGRPVILVFDGCYHGTVDDTLVDRVVTQEASRTVMRPSLLGQVQDLTLTTRVVPFNDIEAVRAALADGQVACVLTEPVLTNIGMVLPEPGFLEALQMEAAQAGSLFIVDETHTISCGPGGYSRMHGLKPDMLVLGKPIAGGLPAAVYGFTSALARRMEHVKADAPPGHSGIGTTLSAGLLSIRLMHTMLREVMTAANYAHMISLSMKIAAGLEAVIAKHALPWCVTQIGARCEYQFCAQRPRNGAQARAAMQDQLEGALHLALLNQGVLLTPFHNMVLTCPDHSREDAARLIHAFDTALVELMECAA